METKQQPPRDPDIAAGTALLAVAVEQKPFNREIEWNYTKFLVGRDGQVVGRYKPADPLDQGMEADVVAALAGKPLPNKRQFVFGGPQ
jgi:glutathione peroxidase-family protein